MRFDNRKPVLSPEAVEALPEFAPLNAQQKSFLLHIAGGAGVVPAVQSAYECKDLRSAKSFAYELMRRRSLQPVLNKMYGQRDDNKAAFLNRLDKLVLRGHKVTTTELNALVLYAAMNNLLPPDYSPFNREDRGGEPVKTVEAYLAEANYREAKRKFETAYLKQKLEEHGWNVSKTAASMGLHRQSLQAKLTELGIQRPERPVGDLK